MDPVRVGPGVWLPDKVVVGGRVSVGGTVPVVERDNERDDVWVEDLDFEVVVDNERDWVRETDPDCSPVPVGRSEWVRVLSYVWVGTALPLSAVDEERVVVGMAVTDGGGVPVGEGVGGTDGVVVCGSVCVGCTVRVLVFGDVFVGGNECDLLTNSDDDKELVSVCPSVLVGPLVLVGESEPPDTLRVGGAVVDGDADIELVAS